MALAFDEHCLNVMAAASKQACHVISRLRYSIAAVYRLSRLGLAGHKKELDRVLRLLLALLWEDTPRLVDQFGRKDERGRAADEHAEDITTAKRAAT